LSHLGADWLKIEKVLTFICLSSLVSSSFI
jgi:hypothetical protein